MIETKYLLDANVLSRLTPQERRGRFVRSHCRAPSEVLHETRGMTDRSLMSRIELPMNGKTLLALQQVMASLEPTDRDLVDLYRNKGNADPILVAVALAAGHTEESALWDTTWVVVTDDAAVRARASLFGVSWLSRAGLVDLIAQQRP